MKKWLDERLLIFAWSFIFLICFIIIFTSPVKAATSSTVLPYLPNNNFNSITQTELDNVLSKILETYPEADFSNIIVFKFGEGAWWTWSEYATIPYYTVYSFPTDTCLSSWNGPDLGTSYFSNFELFNSQFSIAVNLNNVTQYTYVHRQIGDIVDKSVHNSSSYKTFFGDNTITHVESPITFDFNANYPVYTSFTLSTQDPRLDSGHIVAPSGGNTIVNGEATPPDISGDNIGSDKPDIDDYIPTLPTAPTIDNSSLESMVESIYNWLVWQYNALTSTLKGLIKYLGDTITYSIQKVIDNIKNSMQNFYDNMKSLFEPLLNSINELIYNISSGIDYIKEPLSGTAIYDNLSGTGILTNYNSIVTAVNSFKDSFTNLNEPSTYTIPIHLEDLPSSMFGNLTTQYIDLSVINSVKPILRTFVWALVTYGLIITIFDSIANYINGGGDE